MDDKLDRIRNATDLTVAWLSNPNTEADADEIIAFLRSSHSALVDLKARVGTETEKVSGVRYVPAVSVRQSLASPEHIISMIDGKPYSVLRRHLAAHGLTADEYRARYNLKADYPMVAPATSEKRRLIAKQIGLGVKRGGKPESETTIAMAAPARRTLKLPI